MDENCTKLVSKVKVLRGTFLCNSEGICDMNVSVGKAQFEIRFLITILCLKVRIAALEGMEAGSALSLTVKLSVMHLG